MAALSAPHAGNGALPFLIAWGRVLGGLVQLDLGHSAISGTGVWGELRTHLPLTLGLVGEGFVLALLVGIPTGFLFNAGPARRAASPLVQMISAAPIFVGALALVYAAHHLLHWPAPLGTGDKAGLSLLPYTRAEFQAALPPVLAVGLAGAGGGTTGAGGRAAAETQHVSRGGFSFAAWGLTAWDVERTYVIPSVLAGLSGSLGEVVLALLSAAAVIEWVFNYAGAADLFVKSVALRDWSIAAAILFVFAALTMTAHFIGVCLARAGADSGARR